MFSKQTSGGGIFCLETRSKIMKFQLQPPSFLNDWNFLSIAFEKFHAQVIKNPTTKPLLMSLWL